MMSRPNRKPASRATTGIAPTAHYPQANELSLFDLPALIRRSIDTLKLFGIGRVTLKCILIVDGKLQLHIHYFHALDKVRAERVATGSDGLGHYEVFQLENTDIDIVWTKVWRNV
jgi:hypothetical protein